MTDNPPPSSSTTDAALKDRKAKKARARKALRRKIKSLDDAIQSSLADSTYAKRQRQKTALMKKIGGGALGLALVGWLLYVLFAPYKGDLRFGLCKTFIELRVTYPPALRYSFARHFPDKMRVWYIQHDPFGHIRIEKMDCFFSYDTQGLPYLTKAELNRRAIAQDEISAFNTARDAVLSNPPDLTYPHGLPKELKALRQ